VSPPASVEGRERVRLFCALRLPEPVLQELATWSNAHLAGRIVPRANLHITLAFLGHQPASRVDDICEAMRASAAAAAPIEFAQSRYRETRTAGMLVLDDRRRSGTALAGDLQRRLVELGVYESENREWLPHVTVVRFKTRPRLRPGALPELGTFVPSDAAVYLSRLRPSGAEYEVVQSFALGG
jgi:RNA 2',3'-cyclic 3'-phosphodiesterase